MRRRKYLTEDDITVWNLFSFSTKIWETKRLFYGKYKAVTKKD